MSHPESSTQRLVVDLTSDPDQDMRIQISPVERHAVQPDLRMVPLAGTGVSTDAEHGETKCTQIVQIIVGGDKKEKTFIAHRSTLEKLGWFRACLRIPMVESAEGVIRMPEDDPDAFEEVLELIYFAKLSYDLVALFRDNHHTFGDSSSLEVAMEVACMHLVYILAKELRIEAAQNAALDAIITITGIATPSRSQYRHLMENTEDDDSMRQAVLQDIAVWVLRDGSNWLYKKSFYKKYVQSHFSRLGELSEAVVRYKDATIPYMYGKKDRCETWHVHMDTPKCTSACGYWVRSRSVQTGYYSDRSG